MRPCIRTLSVRSTERWTERISIYDENFVVPWVYLVMEFDTLPHLIHEAPQSLQWNRTMSRGYTADEMTFAIAKGRMEFIKHLKQTRESINHE